MMAFRYGNTLIRLVQGDITTQDTDALVNAANSRLVGGGGVDGAIHARGGPAIMAELNVIRQRQGGCPTGEAVITTGGQLSASYVIHTVGPIYRGREDDAVKLAACYKNSLAVAAAHGIASLSFPSISTGVYGYPIKDAAPLALTTVWDELGHYNFAEIRFVLFSQQDYQVYAAAARRVFGAN